MKLSHQRTIRSTLFFLLALCNLPLFSQVGFSVSHHNQDMPEWENAVFLVDTDNQDLLKNGYSVGIDYWVKPLEDYRLELYPEFLLSYSKDEFLNENRMEEVQLATAGINLNMNFYVLNFLSDCDCPTFSKQESFFEKGFFLQVSPGYHYLRGTYEVNEGNELRKNIMNEFVPKLGLGAGLDIGISDFITVTPIVKYDRYFNAEWEGLSNTIHNDPLLDREPTDETSINRFSYGLHIGIRWRQ